MEREKLTALLVPGHITIRQAVQKLNDTAEKILFVVEESGRLVGTVTDGDIRRGILRGVGFDEVVVEVMQKKYVTLNHFDSDLMERAKEIMVKKRIEQIPVLDESGTVMEIITWTDVLCESRVLPHSIDHANQVVIMAGGRGMRMEPFTSVLPKPLIPVGNRPVVEIIMERFSKYGFKKFLYTLNYKKEYMKLYLSERSSNYQVDWIEEGEFLGTAGSLALLEEKITGPFFVTNCDTLLDVDFEEVLRWHEDHGAALTLVGCHNEVKIPFGVIKMNEGRFEGLAEKPVHDVIMNTGVYVMDPLVVSYIPKGEKMDMTELIEKIRQTESISVFPICGGWLDIGQWDEYRKSLRSFNGPIDHEG